MNRLLVEVLWWAIKHRVDWLVALIYRRYCPGSGGLARDCVRRGDCGCDNQDRYAVPEKFHPMTAGLLK